MKTVTVLKYTRNNERAVKKCYNNFPTSFNFNFFFVNTIETGMTCSLKGESNPGCQ